LLKLGSHGGIWGKIWIAINAIQTIKRAHKSSSTTPDYSPILSRLLKSNLLATLRELLRQDHCALALHTFFVVRSEYNNPDLSLYADVAPALARNIMVEDLNRLICDLETDCGGGGIQCDDKGFIGLIKAMIDVDRRESTVRIYESVETI
ncbi:protein THYLAKOID ASSEMBLY 8, chloroplastic-like, partial [Quercus robur]|uniref:protein THYLAKOID ASSEMBLY 8, chloroplastic-like n=1 Tax=Quercus robur TaxID=38942 RepID=UPI002163897D